MNTDSMAWAHIELDRAGSDPEALRTIALGLIRRIEANEFDSGNPYSEEDMQELKDRVEAEKGELRTALSDQKSVSDKWEEWAWENGYDGPDNTYTIDEKKRVATNGNGKWYSMPAEVFSTWRQSRESACGHPELIQQADSYAWMRSVAQGVEQCEDRTRKVGAQTRSLGGRRRKSGKK